MSEYENGTPFSYTDIPLIIEGPVTKGEIRRLMLVHLLVYLPGREGLSDDQLGLQIARNEFRRDRNPSSSHLGVA